MRLTWFPHVAALAFAACHTPYQRSGASGGYEDQRVAQDQFYISVRGNGFTNETTLVGYFHRRATELCFGAGFNSYTHNSSSQSETTQTPSTYTAETNYGYRSSSTQIREQPGMAITKHSVKGYVTCHTPLATATAPTPAPPQGFGASRADRQGAAKGMTLEQGQAVSLKLEPGMSKDEAVVLLGDATDAESQTVGTDTAQPWQALVWNYKWRTADSRGRRLVLYFQRSVDGWRLNSWSWADF